MISVLHNQVRFLAAKTSDFKQGELKERQQLLHVVRRYGPVGGMERYVWELTLQSPKNCLRIFGCVFLLTTLR